ncbi:hypothetical protein KEM55_005349 [Ascosphaera atra]|nr:hypothetical protein KEM55_005349 [Ascosphaera atra]
MEAYNHWEDYKDRVCVALYAPAHPTGKKTSPEDFHWALHVAPKTAPFKSFHTTCYQLEKRTTRRSDGSVRTRWVIDHESDVATGPRELLVEVQVGAIRTTRMEFDESLKEVKLAQEDPTFNERTWIAQALTQLVRDNVLTRNSVTNWDVIEQTVLNFYFDLVNKGPDAELVSPLNLAAFEIAA